MKTAAEAQGELLSLEALMLARAYVYELFHKAFGGEPDAALIAALSSSETVDVLDEFVGESDVIAKLKTFVAGLGEKADTVYMNTVRDEFARFFEGPASLVAIPWESAYIGHEGMVFQANTLEVRKAYADFGLRVKHFKSMPDDHVSMMCAFMAETSRRLLDAFRTRDWKSVNDVLMRQSEFVCVHMTNWLPEYAKSALRVKEAHLYPQLAQGIDAFVSIDLAFITQARTWLREEPDAVVRAAGEYDSAEYFGGVEEALGKLRTLELRGLDDNKLVEIPDASAEC